MSGVFIASLGHSGSTLLDLLLGAHPRLLSLGEIHSTITRFAEPQNPCTCGQPATRCAIWGPIHELWRSDPRRPYAELYAAVGEQVHAQCGADVAPVDSSKHLPALRALAPEQRRELKTILLVKDVRSYVASALDRETAEGSRLRGSALFNVVRWTRGNRRLLRALGAEGRPPLVVGYEELCFETRAILQKLCAGLGLPFHEAMLTPRGDRAHILRGNRMRFDAERRSTVAYDARWMIGARMGFTGLWYLPVMGLNRRLVYSNLASRPQRVGPAADRNGAGSR